MNSLPKISVIMPSYNQAEYLEDAILSVLNQDYPNLEFFILDGGSTDGSIDIIRKYSHRLTWWVSETDGGQVSAINKGLRLATGDWLAWQNSDDIYYPRCFHNFANASKKYPNSKLIIGDIKLVDAFGVCIREVCYVKPKYSALLAEGMLVSNQAAFWKRELHSSLGYLDLKYHCSFDYDWFLRVTQHAECHHIPQFWGALRLHGETKSALLAQRFVDENKQILTGRNIPAFYMYFFKLRRLSLLLLNGRFAYIVRGIVQRTLGQFGKFV
jgi:glycosyltransferase involved in cell wall biosynthesis